MIAAGLPLAGYRIGVTAARKAEEQATLLRRRGAEVVHAPAVSAASRDDDDSDLIAATDEVLRRPVDVFVATTGIGVRLWFAAAERDSRLDDLLAHLRRAEILARGPKSVGALRRFGLREAWTPASEAFDDVLAHLLERDLDGVRVVVQEFGQSLAGAAEVLRGSGAEVATVAVYRVDDAADRGPLFGLVEQIADHRLHAATFTSAAAVTGLMQAASDLGLAEEVASAFGEHVVAACVGPVTSAAFEPWGIPAIRPERSRLAAMIRLLEDELPGRRACY